MNTEFSRQPRFLPDIPRGEIEVPNPPHLNEKPEIGWFGLLAPPAVMLVITLLIAMTMQSIFMLVSIATTIMTLIASLAGATSQIRKYKKKKKEREEKYLQFITDTRSELAIAREQQTKAMNEMFPDPMECVQRIMETDNKLWEKTPSYRDFLSVRLGLGGAPLEMTIQYTKQAVILESDPLLMEPQRLAHEFEKIPQVPITMNLLESGICGIAGDRLKTSELLELILLQIITHQGYDDVRVVVLTSEEDLEKWNWVKFLPHLWDDGYHYRFLLCGKAMAHGTLSELYQLFKERELRAAGGVVLPHYVFIVEDVSLLENEKLGKYLYNDHTKLGISTLFVAQHSAYLPMNCQAVVTLQGRAGELANRETGVKTPFTPDTKAAQPMDFAARKLAPLRIKNASASFTLTSSFSLLDMLNTKRTEELDLLSLWDSNKTYMGMKVPLGARAGDDLFFLDMHETGHGPHGLVAGTTGSGKSELLQSLIISLAIHHHPHDVVFVLIDYKGGGMADVFKGMPHLVGTITNLGGNQTTRALLSIKSELMRRQRLFSEFGVNNIDKYQKLYYTRRPEGMPPIPHLVMIADEFAELKQDQPEFMKELVSTARVGRSLGVHLILATQKPAGVVDDQIWSNSKFKICLKVQDEADSQDVIKRPDAAMIKEPGRAYIQVGNDEVFELFQSAYSGADYDPEGEMQKSSNKAKRIYKVALNGRRDQIYPLTEEKIANKEVPSQLAAMVAYITETAQNAGISPIEGPWLPPLPDTVQLDQLLPSIYQDGQWPAYDQRFKVVVGIADDPRAQCQEQLAIDFVQEGNLFVYGAPGTGKTVLLKTLCLSLALTYSPEDVHVYALDFGGNSLKALERLPHVGGVVTLEQEERLEQFILFLFRIIEERKELFERAGSDGFAEYSKLRADKLPAILVMIDNYFALSETYEELDTQMVVLAREGTKYGIYVVATATNASLIRYKFAVNFKQALSYQMTDKSEYDGIVGRTEGLEPTNVPGRGLVRGKPPLEFQTALPEIQGLQLDQCIEQFGSSDLPAAPPIPMMPTYIELTNIQAEQMSLAIGLANHDLQPVLLDLLATPVVMVAGEALSGKSTLILSWIAMLEKQNDALTVYALDSSAMGIYTLMNKPYVTDLSTVEDLFEFSDGIKEVLSNRRNQLLACRTSGGDISELQAKWEPIIFVFDRLSEFTSNEMYILHELIERIVKHERGMKVIVIAADSTADMASNWDTVGKTIREEQTGVLLGGLKDQNLFNVNVPYGSQERIEERGDGYLIVKNKYTGLRCGIVHDI
ncbi:type VII secretion protein EssC [Paenibacillus aquistagni]|uniref:type VII secretion protein EssC n=1 Tax=Paenibacillus aquistagni TaxID=1852522 RepID=UPI001483C90A|nr:type VII secretion protein EssC [Paenibacillus aquistagni]